MARVSVKVGASGPGVSLDGNDPPSRIISNHLGGVDGFFVDFSTGAPGSPVTMHEARSTAPFDGQVITPGTGATMTYSSSVILPPMTRSMNITVPGPAASAYLTLNAMGRIAYTTYGRMYVYMPAIPPNNWRPVWWYYENTGGGYTAAGAIRITNGGQVSVLNGGGSPSSIATSTTVLAANQWYRIEWGVTRESVSPGNDGVCTVQIFGGPTQSAHSTAPLETLVSPGFHSGLHLDLIQFGSASNSNLSGTVYMAGFADGCKAPVGPYAGPPTGTLTASNPDGTVFDGGFNHAGEFLVTIKEKFTGNGNNYQYQPGQQALLVNRMGEIIMGPSFNLKESDPSTTLADGMFSLTSGRMYCRSHIVAENDDPPDTTYIRYANVPNPSGTDGNWDGNVFTAPSMNSQPGFPATRQPYGGFQTVHRHAKLTVTSAGITGNTHTSTAVDGLSSTLTVGAVFGVTSPGNIPAGATITITGTGTTGTLSVAATSTANGVPLTLAPLSAYFITEVVNPSRVTLEHQNGDPFLVGDLPLNTNNLSWTLPLNPYTPMLYPGGGALCETRTAPPGRQFVRASPADGVADASVTSGSTALTSAAGIQFTALDATRLICLNNDPTQVYKLKQINSATSATLDLPATATLTNVSWSIAGGDYEAALPLPFNPSSHGVTNQSGYVAQFALDATKGFAPVDHTFEAAGAAFYSGASDLTTPPTRVAIRGVTGNLEALYRLSLGTSASSKVETTDTQWWRGAQAQAKTNALVDASQYGIAGRIKNGVPLNADYPAAPPDGTQTLDTSGIVPTLNWRIGGVHTALPGTQQATRLGQRGMLAETGDAAAVSAAGTIATGTMLGGLVGLAAGTPISKLGVVLSTAGVGTAPTLIKLGILDSGGVVLAATADVHADAQWTGTTGYVSFTVSGAPYIVPTTRGYYLVVLQVGVFGTTPLQIGRLGANTIVASMKQYGTNARSFVFASGLTDLTGTITLADPANGSAFYFFAA